MSNESDNKILIKFEIHVPILPGQKPEMIGIAEPPCPPPLPSPPIPAPSPAQVCPPKRRPAGVDLPCKVKVTGTNLSGVICATASGEDPVPSEVWLRIVAPGAPFSGPDTFNDTSPTPLGAPVMMGDPPTYSSWQADAVPNALCATPGTGIICPENDLVIWRKCQGDPTFSVQIIRFRGECSATTDCEDKCRGTSSVAASRLIETMACAYRIEARGFGGPFAPLNGTWVVPRCPCAAEGYAAWASGGDGVHEPRIDLHGKLCGCDPWELRLCCGKCHVVYTCARDKFNPLGASRFVWCGERTSLSECVFPTELRVVPD